MAASVGGASSRATGWTQPRLVAALSQEHAGLNCRITLTPTVQQEAQAAGFGERND